MTSSTIISSDSGSHDKMKPLLWHFVFALATEALARDVRDNNGGNCVGVKSCRPRCVTFRVDRSIQECGSSTGIFQDEINLNPWDIKRFRTLNCETSNTCINDLCGQDMHRDLTVRIGEEGHSGSLYFTSIFLPESDDTFTYCSVYPCPKDECAVPEQMGFGLQFSFFPGLVRLDQTADILLRMDIYLKAAFVGPPMRENESNRFGPLHFEWLDDPTRCREGDFPAYAPVEPPSDPTILTNTTALAERLYCSGEAYNPTPLPQTRPPTTPTSAPTLSPAISLAPTAETTLSSIQVSQLDALEIFYSSTAMSSSESSSRHNWFLDLDYCSYTGVVCDALGYVRSIELIAMRLAGSLPTEIGDLHRLQLLKLAKNNIGGTLPTELAQLADLAHLEVGPNAFVGSIPTELASLKHLKSVTFRYNQLSGTIPELLCNLTGMTAFDISNNVDMHGEIPACFGNLPLALLRVDDVGLIGEVPIGLCNVRPFNGLDPNVYGCSAIGCPAGEFEPTYGRQNGTDTECRQCLVESNVIGSKTCMVVDGNTVTSPAPIVTHAPTKAPTAFPTAKPSSAPPTVAMINEPSQPPSMVPSFAPSAKSPTGAASSAPSVMATPASTAPPTKAKHTVHVTYLFESVSTAMTEIEDILTFERITQDFLVSEGVQSVKQVEILSQSVRPANADENVLTVHDRNQRFLVMDESLFVQMQIEGLASDENFEDSVIAALENTDEYEQALSQELNMFKSPELVVVEPEETQPQKRRVNWKLLGSAVVLSVLAVGTVFLMRRHRRKQDNLMDEPQHAPDHRSTLAAPQPQNNAFIHSVSHGYNPYDVSLSDESSGGWVSEDSEDAFVNEEAKGAVAYSYINSLNIISKGSKVVV